MKKVTLNQFSTVFIEGGPGSGSAPRGPRGVGSAKASDYKTPIRIPEPPYAVGREHLVAVNKAFALEYKPHGPVFLGRQRKPILKASVTDRTGSAYKKRFGAVTAKLAAKQRSVGMHLAAAKRKYGTAPELEKRYTQVVRQRSKLYKVRPAGHGF